jgi:histone acetyltransferase (RNA polymerase elongator complex component)
MPPHPSPLPLGKRGRVRGVLVIGICLEFEIRDLGFDADQTHVGNMTLSPIIIPIFLPNAGCRQRCLFCNQKAVATETPSPSFIPKLIKASITRLPSDKNNREKQIAFYGGSFTAIPQEDQIDYLKEVQPFLRSGQIHSIRVSTRPDALNEEILCMLKEYGVKTVEIGAQSMMDEVLLLSMRGHSAEDTISAVSRLRPWGFEVGLHLMIGLPSDTCDRFFRTLDQVIDLNPDFLRIHPTLVLKGSPLEMLWRTGRYSPLSLEEAVSWLKKGILKLERSSIRIARIGLQPTEELQRHYLAGPYHPALHQLIDSEIAFDLAKQLLQIYSKESEPLFLCHPKEVSNLRGQRNQNILRLKDQFHLKAILIQNKEDVPRGSLGLQNTKGSVTIHRKDLCHN